MGRLAKAARFFKREFLQVLPVMIFFLVGLQLIAFTKHLVLEEQGIVYVGFTEATLCALIIAKVVLVVDLMPFMRIYRGRPLYRPVLYRAVFYTFCVFLVRWLDILVRDFLDRGDLAGGLAAAQAEFIWAHFIFVQIWIFVLFLIYVLIVELRDEFGIEALTKILFSHSKS